MLKVKVPVLTFTIVAYSVRYLLRAWFVVCFRSSKWHKGLG